MEENVKIGEQPTESFTLNAEEQHIDEEKTLQGSPIKKFKSVEALNDAYENLEKSFTQKCQKVKELTDKLETLDNVQKTPEFKKDDWETKVANFFSSHPEAKEYATEISKVLESDEKIACSENSLQSALTKVLAEKYVPYSSLIKDEKFLDSYVYSNNEISEKIINNYLQNIEDKRAMPLVSSVSGSGTFASPIKKPKTLDDAGRMAEAYFKNK